jgi:hypothetical protein
MKKLPLSGQQQGLLRRVKAIYAPLAAALRDGYNDADGDEPAEPVARDVVDIALRRMRVLADDIKSGLYDAERPNDAR